LPVVGAFFYLNTIYKVDISSQGNTTAGDAAKSIRQDK
jgi:hypothetical protein